MADVRLLLRNERNARRISHPHATYSTTGTLVCLVCHIQLKSESLWNSHLRSAQHAMRLQRIRDGTLGRPPGAPAPESQPQVANEQEKAELASAIDDEVDDSSTLRSNKRKADDGDQMVRKKSKVGGLPEGFFDEGVRKDPEAIALPTKTAPPLAGTEIQLPSRPATPMKTSEVLAPPRVSTVDEDEWAAFEADMAAVNVPAAAEAIISAPAMSNEEMAAKSREEEGARRKQQLEAELEGDKEDAARKLEDEFQEMEALEERVRRLREKREALRVKDGKEKTATPSTARDPVDVIPDAPERNGLINNMADEDEDEDEDEDDDEDDDDWDGFRLKT